MQKKANTSFKAFFYPENVTVFGSVKANKIGNQIITQMTEGGFKGKITAVNPKGESPQNFSFIPAYTRLKAVGEAVEGKIDLAVICVPARFVAETLLCCADTGIRAAVILSSGFSETGNLEGEKKISEISKESGIRVIGPNCAGIMNTAWNLFASIEVRALPGHTAFVTQSGAVGGAVLAMAEVRGFGFSKFVSYGNRADVGEVELINFLSEDKETEVIAMYLESIKNGREFIHAAQAVAGRKPFVLIKSGKSRSGERAARSHTGSLAGSDDVFDAALKASGVIRVPGIEEMLDVCEGFDRLPPLKGNRIAIVTNSGGPGILTSDRCEELGLSVPEPSPEIKKRLKSFLSENCSLYNPIDFTVEGTGENYKKALSVLLEGDYDCAVAINVATPFLDSIDLAEGIAGNKVKDKPVASVFMAGRIVEKAVRFLKKNRIPVFPTGERAAYVFSKLYEFNSFKHRHIKDKHIEIEETDMKELPLSEPVLEPQAWNFLKANGFPVPNLLFIRSLGELQKKADRLGFPLVMKVVSPEIIHKSDSGGVVMNIKSPAQLRISYMQMEKKFSDFQFKGVILCRQISEGEEVIIGMKRDPQFGPVVLAGSGGILTELIRDTAVQLAPVNKRQALEMISELKIDRLFRGFRGGAEADRNALADLIVKVSRLSLEYPGIAELDLNPVFVSSKGAVIVDVRIII